MKIYLVWFRVSACDYGVVNVFREEGYAKNFIITGEWKKHITSWCELENEDLWIEERELEVPVKHDY